MYFMVPCDLRPIQSRGDFFNSGEHTGRKYFTVLFNDFRGFSSQKLSMKCLLEFSPVSLQKKFVGSPPYNKISLDSPFIKVQLMHRKKGQFKKTSIKVQFK